MSGASVYPPTSPAGGVRAADGRDSGTAGAGSPPLVARRTQAQVLPPLPGGASVMSQWPLRDFLEIATLPSAVPCVRYHCRQVLWEWHLSDLAYNAELVVSELMTNAIAASRLACSDSPVRVWLLSDTVRVLLAVWDGSPHLPAPVHASADAESGRGLLLVEGVSAQCGTCATPPWGKTVWALIAP
jgi:anti-sigma regulatory factor (Ser/Thr protein kinase)